MRILIDTHVLLWWLRDDRRLSASMKECIADPANDIYVSVASLWEIVVKIRVGKLDADVSEIMRDVDAQGFKILDISPEHFLTLQELPIHHRDPFDHLLIAQSMTEKFVFMSCDQFVHLYGVRVIPARM